MAWLQGCFPARCHVSDCAADRWLTFLSLSWAHLMAHPGCESAWAVLRCRSRETLHRCVARTIQIQCSVTAADCCRQQTGNLHDSWLPGSLVVSAPQRAYFATATHREHQHSFVLQSLLLTFMKVRTKSLDLCPRTNLHLLACRNQVLLGQIMSRTSGMHIIQHMTIV